MPVTINGTTGIAGANGSASTPAVQGEDTNTGVFFPAADAVAVATGGSERLRVDSSGNVGIGTTTFSQPGGVRDVVVSREAVSEGARFVAKGGPSGLTTYAALNSGSHDTFAHFSPSLMFTSGLRFFSAPIDQEPNDANITERARIDSSGNLLVGTTSVQNGVAADPVGITLYGNGAGGAQGVGIFVRNSTNHVLYVNNKTSGGALVFFFNGGNSVGEITSNGTGTTYATSSDYRLKENVQPMQDALSVVAQLNPVTYTWKADGSDGQGFIAHELQAVVPDCVTGEKDAVDAEGNPKYQGVDTSFLVATLVKAVQELTARIAALEAAQ
jgi:hypothetical protein